jgi:LPS-assembly protein
VFFPDQPTVVLRKFPSLEVAVPSRPLANFRFYFDADSSLTGIARRDAAISTPSFVERFDFHPSVEMPIVHSSFLDFSQRFGLRETAYTHSRQAQLVLPDVLNRFDVEYSSNIVGPQFQRDFGRWRHVIEPSVETRYVGGPDRFNETIVVDDVDLVTRTNEVEYAITNRFFTTREVFSWRLAQKYYFDPTFGGAIVPGKRNVFAPLLDITGFAFADGVRRLSPIVSTMRLSTSSYTSTDIEVDYDTRDHLFRSAGIAGNANRGQFGAGISYFFTRRSAIEIPNNQLRGSFTYGNQAKPGLSTAFAFAYDVQHSLFQGSTVQVGYNTNCYGLSFEVSQFNIGARVESRFRFAFTLKDIGSVGTLRPRERLF